MTESHVEQLTRDNERIQRARVCGVVGVMVDTCATWVSVWLNVMYRHKWVNRLVVTLRYCGYNILGYTSSPDREPGWMGWVGEKAHSLLAQVSSASRG